MKRLAFVTLFAFAACGPTVARIAVEPAQAMMSTRGASLILHAEPRDEKGQPVPDVQIGWTSANPAVASVDATGKVTAVKSGVATITAAAGQVQGTAQLRVSIPAALTLTPSEVTLGGVGQTARVAMIVKDDAGNVVPGMPAVWASSDPNVASVDNQGVIHAFGAGKVSVTARTGTLASVVKVTVALPQFDEVALEPKGPLKLQAGKSQQLTLKATQAGQPVMGVTASWSCDNAKVAVVTATGKVTAVKKGKATVTATAGDKTAKLPVVVK